MVRDHFIAEYGVFYKDSTITVGDSTGKIPGIFMAKLYLNITETSQIENIKLSDIIQFYSYMTKLCEATFGPQVTDDWFVRWYYDVGDEAFYFQQICDPRRIGLAP